MILDVHLYIEFLLLSQLFVSAKLKISHERLRTTNCKSIADLTILNHFKSLKINNIHLCQ